MRDDNSHCYSYGWIRGSFVLELAIRFPITQMESVSTPSNHRHIELCCYVAWVSQVKSHVITVEVLIAACDWQRSFGARSFSHPSSLCDDNTIESARSETFPQALEPFCVNLRMSKTGLNYMVRVATIV